MSTGPSSLPPSSRATPSHHQSVVSSSIDERCTAYEAPPTKILRTSSKDCTSRTTASAPQASGDSCAPAHPRTTSSAAANPSSSSTEPHFSGWRKCPECNVRVHVGSFIRERCKKKTKKTTNDGFTNVCVFFFVFSCPQTPH